MTVATNSFSYVSSVGGVLRHVSKVITHRRYGTNTPDLYSGTFTDSSPTDTLIGGVIEQFDEEIVDGSTYREGDLKIGIPAINLLPHNIVPISGDTISTTRVRPHGISWTGSMPTGWIPSGWMAFALISPRDLQTPTGRDGLMMLPASAS